MEEVSKNKIKMISESLNKHENKIITSFTEKDSERVGLNSRKIPSIKDISTDYSSPGHQKAPSDFNDCK
jgi:hypothetical protein